MTSQHGTSLAELFPSSAAKLVEILLKFGAIRSFGKTFRTPQLLLRLTDVWRTIGVALIRCTSIQLSLK